MEEITSDSPYCFWMLSISDIKSFRASFAVDASASTSIRIAPVPSMPSDSLITSLPYASCSFSTDFLIAFDCSEPSSVNCPKYVWRSFSISVRALSIPFLFSFLKASASFCATLSSKASCSVREPFNRSIPST